MGTQEDALPAPAPTPPSRSWGGEASGTPGTPGSPVPRAGAAPRARWRRLGLGFAHPGAAACVGLLVLGLALELLATPPGPVPGLVLVADVPYLLLLLVACGRRWKRWAALYGALHYAMPLRWLAEIHPAQVVGVAGGLLPVWLVASGALRWLAGRRTPWLLAAPVVLVLEEMARTVWLGGMPWPARSLAFAGWEWALPAASWLGAYVFSFGAAAVGALAASCLGAGPVLRAGTASRSFVGVLVVAALAVPAGYLWREGSWIEPGSRTGSPVLLAVQGNVPQSLKHSLQGDAPNRILRTHLSLTREGLASARAAGAQVGVVLWPETMVPWPFVDPHLARRFPDAWANQVRVAQNVASVVAGEESPPLFLLGAIYSFRRGDEEHPTLLDYGTHDSMFLVDPAKVPPSGSPIPAPPEPGESPPWILARHDKRVLVPGGEYTPGGDLLYPLKAFRDLVAEIPELDPGAEDQVPFDLPLGSPGPGGAGDHAAVRAGTIICFEVMFPAACRAWREAGAEVLLNAANYGWFGPTGFRAMLRAAAALRAAETGAFVVVAGNTGPTLLLRPDGAPYGEFGLPADESSAAAPAASEAGAAPAAGSDASTFREAWVWGEVDPTRNERTPYVRWGDAPWLGLAALVLLLAALRGPRSRDRPVT